MCQSATTRLTEAGGVLQDKGFDRAKEQLSRLAIATLPQFGSSARLSCDRGLIANSAFCHAVLVRVATATDRSVSAEVFRWVPGDRDAAALSRTSLFYSRNHSYRIAAQ